MGVRRADHDGVGLARQDEVVAVTAAAGQQPGILEPRQRRSDGAAGHRSERAQRYVQEHAELVGEIAAHAGMDAALLVEETAARRDRKDALVPDAGMDVDAEAAVGPEG